jgi:hypothetical protein
MKYITILAAMLINGSALAGTDVIAPPVTKYVEAPLPSKRPTNFGKTDNQKVNQRIVELTTRK